MLRIVHVCQQVGAFKRERSFIGQWWTSKMLRIELSFLPPNHLTTEQEMRRYITAEY